MNTNTSMSRRFALLGAAASTAALAVPAVAVAAKPELEQWLETAPVEDVIQYHAMKLAIALCKKRPGLWRFNTSMVENGGFVMFGRAPNSTISGIQQNFYDDLTP
jgi:hypothetical protein